jgi:uncharacterized protein (DUF305 family)
MHVRTFAILALTVGAALASGAIAQQQSPHGDPSQQTPSAGEALRALPASCRTAAQGMPQAHMLQNLPQAHGTTPMQDMSVTANMPPATQDYMQSMWRTSQPMMAGMMIQDPDLAFLCAMIPHHQGAIEMSRAVLKHGRNPEAKKIAERIIKDQEKEIAELTDLAEKHGK